MAYRWASSRNCLAARGSGGAGWGGGGESRGCGRCNLSLENCRALPVTTSSEATLLSGQRTHCSWTFESRAAHPHKSGGVPAVAPLFTCADALQHVHALHAVHVGHFVHQVRGRVAQHAVHHVVRAPLLCCVGWWVGQCRLDVGRGTVTRRDGCEPTAAAAGLQAVHAKQQAVTGPPAARQAALPQAQPRHPPKEESQLSSVAPMRSWNWRRQAVRWPGRDRSIMKCPRVLPVARAASLYCAYARCICSSVVAAGRAGAAGEHVGGWASSWGQAASVVAIW